MSKRSAPSSLAILYVDEQCAVVDQPGGEGEVTESDLRRLPELAGDERLRVAYRPDGGASGVMLCARSDAAYEALRGQLANGGATIVYHALVSGYVTENGEVDLPLRFDRRSQRLEAAGGRGKSVRTTYRVVERVAGNTWLECRPDAERRQQVRAHLAAIGHPVSVDSQYGSEQPLLLSFYKSGYRPNRRQEERPLCARLTLHAAAAEFVSPASGERMSVWAPLPRDLAATLKQLGRLA
ncbi:MAG: pseudouridine synthase [Phycisphaerae bacterium]|jgi:23S rRNA-/tRNA-specific pseudouridylate synthase